MNGKRIKTYHGVPIPPWRDKKKKGTSHTIWFVITGKVPSKKNNQLAVASRKMARDYIRQYYQTHAAPMSKKEVYTAVGKVIAKMRPNQAYMEFLEKMRPEIEKQRQYWHDRLEKKGLIWPITKCSMNVRYYFAHRYLQDSVNKHQSVQDLLQDCGVIAEDDYTTVDPITIQADLYHGEITDNIVVVNLTFNL